MSNIIDHTAFENGEFKITFNNSVINLVGKLDEFCGEVESDILTDLMGDVLYLDFKTNKDDDKYTLLIDGLKENNPYDNHGTKCVFYGLKDMLKYFTYFLYIESQYTFNSTLGEISPTAENGTFNIPTQKLCKAWNKGIDEFYKAVNYIRYANSSSMIYENFLFKRKEKINQFGI